MKRWSLLMLLVALPALADDVQFYQTADRAEVGSDDTFRLTVVTSNAPDSAQLELPSSPNFEVLSKSQSTQMSYQFGGGGPGVIQRIQKYTLVMRANRTGKLTIPPSVLKTGDKTLKTEPVQMTVRPGHIGGQATQPRQQWNPFGQNPFGQLPDPFQGFPFPQFPDDDQDLGPPDVNIPRSDSDLFLRATLDKNSVYVGEQTTLSIYIFSRVDLSSVDQVTMPKLDGFWSEDIESPSQLAAEQKMINGVPYRAYLLKRRALFPVKAGSLEIGATEAQITTGFLFAGTRFKRTSNTLTVQVKPLPPGAPPGFSNNNVGRWHLSTEVSQNQVELGQPVTVRVILDGRGNLKNVAPPPLTGPAALKIYDPTTTDKVVTAKYKFGGRRVLEYLVMAQQTGTFILPGLSFPYFDPEAGHYDVAKTDPITLTVVPSAGGATTLSGPNAAAAAAVAKNVLTAGGLKPLRIGTAFVAQSEPLWRRRFFLPAVLAPAGLWLALALGGLFWGAVSKEDERTRKKKQARAAWKRLAAAEKLRSSGNSAEFYGEVEKALLHFLEAKLGGPVGGLTREALGERMQAAGVAEARRQSVFKVLDTCDVGRFAPGGGDAARSRALEEAAEAMETWDAR